MVYALHRCLISASLPIALLSFHAIPGTNSFLVYPQDVLMRNNVLLFSSQQSLPSHASEGDYFDIDAYQKRNQIRSKFGLKPLSEEEFAVLQDEVKIIEQEQIVKFDASKQERVEQQKISTNKSQASRRNVFGNFFSTGSRPSCQTNDDCQEPDVCCDMVFGKVCCYGGEKSRLEEWKLAYVPVPQSYDWNS